MFKGNHRRSTEGENTTCYFLKETSEIKSKRKYLVVYSNFFGRGHKQAICHFSSTASPFVHDSVQLYKNTIVPQVKVNPAETTNQKNKEFRGGIMYHYDPIKHSPPQDYNRSAILSVGSYAGDEHSKRLSDNAALTFGSDRCGGLHQSL